MKAVGYEKISEKASENSLIDIELDMPVAEGRDLLVEVRAIAVNPVDTKIRAAMNPEGDQYKVLGWDAVGIVKEVGPEVTMFKAGDRVYYAGDLTRPGTNMEFHLVDERITGYAPESLSDAEAAALPLTSITSWELLFDRLQIKTTKQASQEKLLVIGAAGGVGSILVQLARRLTNLTVIGTASREETESWLYELGVHKVINHRKPLSEELGAINISEVDYVISLTNTEQHLSEIIKSIKPQGKFALIDDPKALDVKALKQKCISLHWEFMFTRSLFQTDDMIGQHQLLNEVSRLVDDGIVKTTVGQNLGRICAENLIEAHKILESQTARGKLVLEGF